MPNSRVDAPVIAIIPARYASTRFPGKPLADETGKPLIQHVVESTLLAPCLSRVVVATDDERIAQAVKKFGGEYVMTREDHPNGTSRLAEAVATLNITDPNAIIVNVQGDEPEIEPAIIETIVARLATEKTNDDRSAAMATLGSPLHESVDITNPNIVKLVMDQRGYAMYFSRSAIPFVRDPNPEKPHSIYKHLGMYAYRRHFLDTYVALSPTPLEQAESLEQLRVIEHGHRIAVGITDATPAGIDTPEQYAAFVARHAIER